MLSSSAPSDEGVKVMAVSPEDLLHVDSLSWLRSHPGAPQPEAAAAMSPLAPVSPCSLTNYESPDFLFYSSEPPRVPTPAKIVDKSRSDQVTEHNYESFRPVSPREGRDEHEEVHVLKNEALRYEESPASLRPGIDRSSAPFHSHPTAGSTVSIGTEAELNGHSPLAVSLPESVHVKKWRLAEASTSSTGRSPLDGVPMEFLSNLSVYRDELRQMDRELYSDNRALNGRAFDRLLGLLEQNSDKSASGGTIPSGREVRSSSYRNISSSSSSSIPEPPPIVQRSIFASLSLSKTGNSSSQPSSSSQIPNSELGETFTSSLHAITGTPAPRESYKSSVNYRGPFFPDLSRSCDVALEKSVDVSQRIDKSVGRVESLTERIERGNHELGASSHSLNTTRMLAPNWTLQLHLKRTLAKADEIISSSGAPNELSRNYHSYDGARRSENPTNISANSIEAIDESLFTYSPIPGSAVGKIIRPEQPIDLKNKPKDVDPSRDISLIFTSVNDPTRASVPAGVDSISRRWLDSTTAPPSSSSLLSSEGGGGREHRAQAPREVAARLDASLRLLGSAVSRPPPIEIKTEQISIPEVENQRKNINTSRPNVSAFDVDQISEIICASVMSTASHINRAGGIRANRYFMKRTAHRSRTPDVSDSGSEEETDGGSAVFAEEFKEIYRSRSSRPNESRFGFFPSTPALHSSFTSADYSRGDGRPLVLASQPSVSALQHDRRFDDVMSSYRSLTLMSVKSSTHLQNSSAFCSGKNYSSAASHGESYFHLMDECGDDVDRLIELGRQAVCPDPPHPEALHIWTPASQHAAAEKKRGTEPDEELGGLSRAAEARSRTSALPRAARRIDDELTLSPFKDLSLPISLHVESNDRTAALRNDNIVENEATVQSHVKAVSSPVKSKSPGPKADPRANNKTSIVVFGRTVRAEDSMIPRPSSSRADRARAAPSSSSLAAGATAGGVRGARSARNAANMQRLEFDRKQLSRHLFEGHLAATDASR